MNQEIALHALEPTRLSVSVFAIWLFESLRICLAGVDRRVAQLGSSVHGRIEPMKRYMIAASVLAALATATAAFFAPEKFWQPLLINVATTFLALALGVIAVNIYLERDIRRDAVRSILSLANEAIANFHNTFLDLMWSQFSKDEFGEMRDKYMKAHGDIMVLAPESRQRLYDSAKQKSAEVAPLLQKLDETLSEITALVGWNMDARVLQQALQARTSIRKYRAIALDDKPETVGRIAKHLLDIDTFSATVHRLLEELGQIKQKRTP